MAHSGGDKNLSFPQSPGGNPVPLVIPAIFWRESKETGSPTDPFGDDTRVDIPRGHHGPTGPFGDDKVGGPFGDDKKVLG